MAKNAEKHTSRAPFAAHAATLPRHRRTGLWLILAVLAALLIAGGAGAYTFYKQAMQVKDHEMAAVDLVKTVSSLDQLKEVGRLGISKINVDTDIRLAVTRNVRLLFTRHPQLKEDGHLAPVWRLMDGNPSAFDPRVYLAAVMDTVMYGTIPSHSVQLLVDAIKDGVMEGIGRLLVEFGQIGKAREVRLRSLEDMREFYRREGR